MNDTVKNNNDIIDISLNIQRQRVRIDGDDSKILLLNLADPNINTRLSETVPKMEALFTDFGETKETDSNAEKTKLEELVEFGEKAKSVDDKMKLYIDYVFDSNVSEVCAGNASMLTIKDGKMMFESIMEQLSKLYSEAMSREINAVVARMKKHTQKYVQARKRK